MKKFIRGLQNNRQVYAFIVFGIILILFPAQIGKAAPYLLGILSAAYGALNIIICLKYPKSSISLGRSIVMLFVGLLILMTREEAISFIGVIWAMISLYESGVEIDEYRNRKKIRFFNIICIAVSFFLAALLITDPFAHFNTHVRILGLEIIAATIIRLKKGAADPENA